MLASIYWRRIQSVVEWVYTGFTVAQIKPQNYRFMSLDHQTLRRISEHELDQSLLLRWHVRKTPRYPLTTVFWSSTSIQKVELFDKFKRNKIVGPESKDCPRVHLRWGSFNDKELFRASAYLELWRFCHASYCDLRPVPPAGIPWYFTSFDQRISLKYHLIPLGKKNAMPTFTMPWSRLADRIHYFNPMLWSIFNNTQGNLRECHLQPRHSGYPWPKICCHGEEVFKVKEVWSLFVLPCWTLFSGAVFLSISLSLMFYLFRGWPMPHYLLLFSFAWVSLSFSVTIVLLIFH